MPSHSQPPPTDNLLAVHDAAAAGDDKIDVEALVRSGLLTRDEARALEHAQQSDDGAGGLVRMEALPETGKEPRAKTWSDEAATRQDDNPKDAVKESAMKHKRHWVRVTRVCNQRCTFCLDSMNQDGSMVDVASLKAYILLGRRMGRERLILSGGEASVHPNFIELIRYGKQVGYDWVQTVTNGMMFSYKRFAQAAAQAGLDEATVSMHGHTAHLHDKLTGTPGAFVTGVAGMKNLQATGKVVVNVDVVINKQNYKALPDIIQYYHDNLHIREFDLLHIIPFGRGFDEHRHSLFFDLNDAVPYFRKAFAWSDKPGVYLWTNRLPVVYLEGHERLIQDPHKLFSEFDGGRHNFEGFLRKGQKPDCWGERCDYCFLDGPCRSTMFPYREQLEAGTFPVVALDARHVWQGDGARAAFERQKPERCKLTARDADDARHALGNLPFSAPVTVELDAGADAAPLHGDERVQRFVVTTLADAERMLAGDAREVEIRLTRELAAWLLERPQTVQAWAGRLVLALRTHEYLSQSQAADPDPETLGKLAKLGAKLKNVPKCVAGAETEPHDYFALDAKLLDGSGSLDLDRYVAHYVEQEYFTKSLRCGRCAEFDKCRGMHVNYVRNFGFSVMTPLDEAGLPLPDQQSFEDLAQRVAEATAKREKRDQQRLLGLHKPRLVAANDLAIGRS
jgi:MoaA/NifB/PqqE/SkfB family radical SAM enzyme